MQSALRPYATAGVAIVGAGLIASPPPPFPAPLADALAIREVALTDASSPLGDFLSPWIDQYNTAAENASVLANNFYLAPAVALQQAIVNHSDFLSQVLSDPSPSTIADVVNQMQENLATVSGSIALIGADADTINTAIKQTLNAQLDLNDGIAGHVSLLSLLPSVLPPDLAHTLTPILNLLASPLSGIIIGGLGPFLSPGVALINSIQAIVDDLGTDPSAALQDLIALPANMVGSFFNGATLDLDALLPAINSAGLLPAGNSILHLELALGGLFSPGEVGNGPYELFDSGGNVVASVPAVGGSMFNEVGLTLQTNLVPAPEGVLNVPAAGIGPLGAWQGLSELIGAELGSGWNGKNAPAIPPGTGIHFPTIPDDFFDDGGTGSAAATELPSSVQDLLTALTG